MLVGRQHFPLAAPSLLEKFTQCAPLFLSVLLCGIDPLTPHTMAAKWAAM